MESCLYCPVGYGRKAHRTNLDVAHTFSGRTTSQNLHFLFKQTNNQSWSPNSVQSSLKNPTVKKAYSNNHIIWSLQLPLQTVCLSTTQTIWNPCMEWAISTLLLWLTSHGKMIRSWQYHHLMGLFRSSLSRKGSLGRSTSLNRALWGKWSQGRHMYHL